MKTFPVERLAADPTFGVCITDYGSLVFGGPRDDYEVDTIKISHWRQTTSNRGNDFICDRQDAGMPSDEKFEAFVDALSDPRITTFERYYDKDVPGCRGEVLKQIALLERDPRPLSVANTLLGSCMWVAEYCEQLPPHIEWN